MAVTKIESIKSKLKQSLEDIIDESKIDGKLLVTGGNCAPEVAYLEFKMTEGKYIAFKAPNQQRFCRGKTIGEEYTKEAIELRIKNSKVKEILINKDMIINENENSY